MQLFQSSGLQVLHSFLNDSRQHFHWRSSSFPDVLDRLRTTAFAGQVAWGYFFPEGMEVFKTAFPKAHLHASRTVSASRSCPFTKAFALHIDSSEEEVCVDDHCLVEGGRRLAAAVEMRKRPTTAAGRERLAAVVKVGVPGWNLMVGASQGIWWTESLRRRLMANWYYIRIRWTGGPRVWDVFHFL